MRLAHIGRIESSLAWGERFFARHGGKTVFLARWIFGLRIFGAWIAGMVHMPWRVFFLWNAAGGITWCASVIGLGYFFGHSLHVIEKVLGVGGAIAVVTAAVAASCSGGASRSASCTQRRRARDVAAPTPSQRSGERGDARPAARERLGERDDVDGVDLRAHAHVVGEIGRDEVARALRAVSAP